MLIFTRVEFIFLTIADKNLCFRFVLVTGLIKYGHLGIAEFMHSDKAFFAPHTTLPARRLGVHKELRGNKDR